MRIFWKTTTKLVLKNRSKKQNALPTSSSLLIENEEEIYKILREKGDEIEWD